MGSAKGLVALQDSNCTTVSREFDLSQARAESAEKSAELRAEAVDRTVEIRLEESGGLVVDRARGGLGLEIERIVARETHFHEAFAALHGVKPGADEVAVKEDISGGCAEIHVGKGGLENLSATTNGIEVELAGTLGANERPARSFHDNVAGNLLQVHIPGDAFQGHVAHHLFHINQTIFGL